MPAPAWQPDCDDTELERVRKHRFLEAREAGLTLVEARLFSESTVDVGLLRLCVKGHCPAAMIARIMV